MANFNPEYEHTYESEPSPQDVLLLRFQADCLAQLGTMQIDREVLHESASGVMRISQQEIYRKSDSIPETNTWLSIYQKTDDTEVQKILNIYQGESGAIQFSADLNDKVSSAAINTILGDIALDSNPSDEDLTIIVGLTDLLRSHENGQDIDPASLQAIVASMLSRLHQDDVPYVVNYRHAARSLNREVIARSKVLIDKSMHNNQESDEIDADDEDDTTSSEFAYLEDRMIDILTEGQDGSRVERISISPGEDEYYFNSDYDLRHADVRDNFDERILMDDRQVHEAIVLMLDAAHTYLGSLTVQQLAQYTELVHEAYAVAPPYSKYREQLRDFADSIQPYFIKAFEEQYRIEDEGHDPYDEDLTPQERFNFVNQLTSRGLEIAVPYALVIQGTELVKQPVMSILSVYYLYPTTMPLEAVEDDEIRPQSGVFIKGIFGNASAELGRSGLIVGYFPYHPVATFHRNHRQN